jgi:hypothetical protein
LLNKIIEYLLLARLIAVYIPVLILLQAVDDGNEAIAAEVKSNIMRALIRSGSIQVNLCYCSVWLSAVFIFFD